MRRFGLCSLGLLFALVAVVALAAPPTRVHDSLSGAWDAPAGTLCDFDYHQEFRIEDDFTLFSDGRVIIHDTQYVTHTNSDSGFSLSEVDHIQLQIDPSKNRVRQVGVVWHLRTPGGKVVVVQAGQILYDFTTGEILKFTPNISPAFGEIICPALGGDPA